MARFIVGLLDLLRGGGPQRLVHQATNAAHTASQWTLDLEERVVLTFQLYAGLVLAAVMVVFIASATGWLSPLVVLIEGGILLMAAVGAIIFGARGVLRTAVWAWFARHASGLTARVEHTARMTAVRVLSVGAISIALGWLLWAFPVRDTLAGALWATAMVAGILAIVAPPRSRGGSGKARKAWALVTGAFILTAAICSAVTVEDSPVHEAVVATSEYFEPDEVYTPDPAVWRFEETYLLEPGQRVRVNIRGAATAADIPESSHISWGVTPGCMPYELQLKFVLSGRTYISTSAGGSVDVGDERADFWLSTLSEACPVTVHAKVG